MVFSSSTFLFIFLPLVLGGYYLIRPELRNALLLFVSLGFYAFGESQFIVVMFVTIIINYLVALLIDRSEKQWIKKLFLIIGIISNLICLIVFKYMNFFLLGVKKIFPNTVVTSFVLPVGISFFTFQAISYVIDVYRGEKAQKNLLNVGLYISFFPQLVAGPIVRYRTIVEEFDNRNISWTEFGNGVIGFLNGLIKKVIFANNIAIVADKAFDGNTAEQSILFSWLGALAYTLQIYFDFSGYSDMAIGLGRMFGFHFPKNFDYPYVASSITDFWRRWHISLSSWFRDYVYIPLGGSMGGHNIRNLFVVWLLTGIWHGANWTFIVWGLTWFVILVIEKYFIRPDEFKSRGMVYFYRILVFLAIMFCWVLFRSESIRAAVRYFKSMIGLNGNPLIDGNWLFYTREYLVLIVLAVLLSTPLVRNILNKVKIKIRPLLYEMIRELVYTFLFLICISYLVMGSHNPFIYFNF